MADIKKAIRDLATIAVGILVVDVIFTATGMALASLNSATANLASYVSVSTLAGVISTITPIVNLVFIIGGIVVLLELFGADSLLQVG
ncbi:MAG: hypothetical protein RXO43_02620 [Candidatus Micrarchaeota archaeon]